MKNTILIFIISLGLIGFAQDKNPIDELTEKKVLFDGKNLDSWEYAKPYWSLPGDGSVKGTTVKLKNPKTNTFLITKDKKFVDFELNVSYKLTTKNNSGIIYRCLQIGNKEWYRVKGYQCEGENDMSKGAFMYGEADRGWIALPGEMVCIKSAKEKVVVSKVNDHKTLIEKKFVNQKDWNHLRIVARGNHFLHYINGHLAIEVIDEDPKNFRNEGAIALQIHRGSPMTVFFKDVVVKKYKSNYGKTVFLNPEKWKNMNLSAASDRFSSKNAKGNKGRGYKANHIFNYNVYSFKSLTPELPKSDGVFRFQASGSFSIGGKSLSAKGVVDEYRDIEVIISKGKKYLYEAGKYIGEVDSTKIDSKYLSARNFIFIPEKK